MSLEQNDDSVAEQLSALVDGELTADERRFLLRRIGHDARLRSRLGRYYLMRDALQRRLPPQPSPQLGERVREALAEEPTHQRPATPKARGSRRSLLGGAVAATVAAVTVLWWQGGGERPPRPAADAPGGGGEPASVQEQPSQDQPAQGQPAPSQAPAPAWETATLFEGEQGVPSAWPQAGRELPRLEAVEQPQRTARLPESMPSRLQPFLIDYPHQLNTDPPDGAIQRVQTPEGR